jgi:hypothetical protein
MKNCPVCYTELEVRDCAPCHDCGDDPKELDDFRAGIHVYREWIIYNDLRLVLCDFCDVDFGSYIPSYFGFKNGKRLSLTDFAFVRDMHNPVIEKDNYCTECRKRLKFLKFLAAIREMNAV